MRIIGLLALTILLPLTAYAALLNINTANATLLDTLPGIGPSKASAIVDYRTKNGPFVTIEDIQKVSGIGPVTFANMKDLITVDAAVTSGGQLSAPAASYQKVQADTRTAPPIIQTNIQQHDEAVSAPTTAPDAEVVVGAAVPPPEPVPPKNTRAFGLFHSIWTLGLLGVIVIAGGVFIFL